MKEMKEKNIKSTHLTLGNLNFALENCAITETQVSVNALIMALDSLKQSDFSWNYHKKNSSHIGENGQVKEES